MTAAQIDLTAAAGWLASLIVVVFLICGVIPLHSARRGRDYSSRAVVVFGIAAVFLAPLTAVWLAGQGVYLKLTEPRGTS